MIETYLAKTFNDSEHDKDIENQWNIILTNNLDSIKNLSFDKWTLLEGKYLPIYVFADPKSQKKLFTRPSENILNKLAPELSTNGNHSLFVIRKDISYKEESYYWPSGKEVVKPS